VKRLQVYVDEQLDDALSAEARRQRTSKAALIRQLLTDRLRRADQPLDPLDELVGSYDEEPGCVDELVYGR
jgi:hypothetical protein